MEVRSVALTLWTWINTLHHFIHEWMNNIWINWFVHMYFRLYLLFLRNLGIVLSLHTQACTGTTQDPSLGSPGMQVALILVVGPPRRPLLMSWCLLWREHLSAAKEKGWCIYPVFPSPSETRHKTFLRLFLTIAVDSTTCPRQSLCQWAEMGWDMQEHSVCAPATSIYFHWVTQSSIFISTHI